MFGLTGWWNAAAIVVVGAGIGVCAGLLLMHYMGERGHARVANIEIHWEKR